MRVVVTGGAGYIGSVTVRVLLDAGHEVIVLDSLERGHRRAVDARATLVVASVGDGEVLDSVLLDTDAVVHLAGYIDVAESLAKPDLYYRKNLAEPSMMLDRMTSAGVKRLVFSSTAAVYGEPRENPVTEDSARVPVSVYGASKLAFERMIELTESAGLMTAVRLRYFNAAGAWPDGSLGEAHAPETHIVPLLFRAATEPQSRFALYGDDYPTRDGTCVRDYVHVLDLAEAHLLALEYLANGAGPLTCNIGSSVGYSNLEVIRACEEACGRQIAVDRVERRPGDPATLVASNARAREVLGWEPKRDLRQMVTDAWSWHSAHPEGFGTGRGKG